MAVETVAPRAGVAPDLVTAYGTATPALDGGMTLSLQQDGRVLAIAVTPGETVRAGERLLDFGASAAAVSTYQQAVSALTAARQQRAHTAQLLGQQLATRDQLAQADKAVADAQSTLDALHREGADRPSQTLQAPFDGTIATIPVAQGDRVQPGATMMTITRLDGLVVTVGIDPGERVRVHPRRAGPSGAIGWWPRAGWSGLAARRHAEPAHPSGRRRCLGAGRFRHLRGRVSRRDQGWRTERLDRAA